MADHRIALDELRAVLDGVDQVGVSDACNRIAGAGQIVLYGCGREGLQIQGLAMRLFHLGLPVAMVGDMTTPPLGAGDLFVVSSGPGALSTAEALMRVARDAGADVLYLTANPHTPEAALATQVLTLPAQTMADDQGVSARSVLPMGSVYEGALFILFEMMVLHLKANLGATPDEMRARHNNME